MILQYSTLNLHVTVVTPHFPTVSGFQRFQAITPLQLQKIFTSTADSDTTPQRLAAIRRDVNAHHRGRVLRVEVEGMEIHRPNLGGNLSLEIRQSHQNKLNIA